MRNYILEENESNDDMLHPSRALLQQYHFFYHPSEVADFEIPSPKSGEDVHIHFNETTLLTPTDDDLESGCNFFTKDGQIIGQVLPRKLGQEHLSEQSISDFAHFFRWVRNNNIIPNCAHCNERTIVIDQPKDYKVLGNKAAIGGSAGITEVLPGIKDFVSVPDNNSFGTTIKKTAISSLVVL
jgi:hypothetical protein